MPMPNGYGTYSSPQWLWQFDRVATLAVSKEAGLYGDELVVSVFDHGLASVVDTTMAAISKMRLVIQERPAPRSMAF